MKRKPVTMADVAREANVSITTVSHVINLSATISAETTKRVHSAIEKLDYQTSKASSVLKSNDKRMIGILTPDISNEFYSRCVQAACEEAWRQDYIALVCGTRHDKNAEVKHIKALIKNGVSGLILFGGMLDERYIMEAAKKIPVVLGDRYLLNHPVPSVITDNISAMRQLMARLSKAGYKRVGYISEDLGMSNVKDRYMGFKIGLEESGVPFLPEHVHFSASLRLDKIEAAHRFVQEQILAKSALPEVYVCTSDLIAAGVLAALFEAGYRVPRDIGVVGFDGITLSAYTRPPLTTIAQNMRQLGKNCCLALSQQLEGGDRFTKQIVVNTKLIVRESVRM